MGETKIRLLAPEIVHRIAAGEVVENPASVIKELVENSIDASATQVAVKIVNGGFELIEIKDNGSGMSRADLEACCQRHATSKLQSLEDLDQIFSLGFRGEALAALSAISQLEILSCVKTPTAEAWKLSRNGATFSSVPTTHPVGTTVRVHRLFFNTPARLKFLKSEASETARCLRVLKELAVAHPEIAISFFALSKSGEVEEELAFSSSGRLARLAELYKKKSEDFLQLRQSARISGLRSCEIFVQKVPHVSRTSKDIYFVVNGRAIEDRRLPYVLREAFGSLIEAGAYPRGVVYVEVDPGIVDVNVHPQKKEVRWAKDFPLYSLIFESVKAPLQRESSPAFPAPKNNPPNGDLFASADDLSRSFEKNSVIDFAPRSTKAFPQAVAALPSVSDLAARTTLKFSQLRVVGEVGAAWLVCEDEKGMLLIDQHAAHERINFHEYMRRELFPSVALLLPLLVRVPAALKNDEEKLLRALEPFGFEGQLNSRHEIEFCAVPKTERKIDWKQLFDEIAERVENALSVEALLFQWKVWIASSLACHGSVRRGQRLTNDEIKALLQKLDEVDWKEFCPHGRPTWIRLSHAKLEEEFHRS